MRKWTFEYDNGFQSSIIIGNAVEISRMVRKMWNKDEFGFSHCDFPKFNPDRYYGLSISLNDDEDYWYYYEVYVISQDTIMEFLRDSRITVRG